MTEITLLDGAMGTELRRQGAVVPSHITSIWSAQALLDEPQAVVKVHGDYIDAGADILTINNYMVTPPLLGRKGLEHEVESLTRLAVDLAKQAKRAKSSNVRIAGSLPPLTTSYRADLVAGDESILADYRRIVRCLDGKVDILLCETMSSSREARAAATAAKETDLPVWVSFTLQGNHQDCLPSGERIDDAFHAIEALEPDAVLVNCCGANFITSALSILRKLTDLPLGGYGHSANAVAHDGAPHDGPIDSSEDERVEYLELDTRQYCETARHWIDIGASIVGGCCSTQPDHISLLRQMIDSRSEGESDG